MNAAHPRRLPRIMLVILSLSPGGAERVISGMANWWAAHGHEVAILTPWGSGHDHYRLDPNVRRIALGYRRGPHAAWRTIIDRVLLLFRLRRAVLEYGPDAVISFIDLMNIVTVMALAGTKIPLIISERIDPRHHPISPLRSLARRLFYPRSSTLVVQTESVAGWARTIMPASKIVVIPNSAPSLTEPAPSPGRNIPGGPYVLAMGRLDEQKGHDLLIRAFAEARREQGEWKLVILGEGPWRTRLENLASTLGISDAVVMPGIVSEPAEWLRKAGVFVHPSRYEGFPNALLEAMACGCPVVAADCPSGPAEIVRHGENGLLVSREDVPALTEAMLSLMRDSTLRQKLGARAVEITAAFSRSAVMARWDALIGKLTGKGHGPGCTRRDIHILLVISSLGSGGAERMISGMANWWAAHGRKVTLLTLMGTAKDHYTLHPDVKRIALNFWEHTPRRVINKHLDRFVRLRTAITREHPDVVVSFIDITNVRTIAALLGTRLPVIVSERVDPRRYSIGAFWSLSRRLLYPFAQALVVQTHSVTAWARQVVPERNVRVLNNFIRTLPEADDARTGYSHRQPLIIAVGRLVEQKGHDLLIQAFAMTGAAHAGWRLVILGEGPERSNLERLAVGLGIRDAVDLPGIVDEPARWLCKARLFVLASRFEGFPNVLLEAMACGCAVIAADCPSGPAEIIHDGENGLLVSAGDAAALSNAMLGLMGDEERCRRLSTEALRVKETFSQESVMAGWDDLIEDSLKTGPRHE